MEDKAKAEAMDDLFARAVEKAGEVCRPGVGLVWGDGPLDAPIAFVGEAPGQQETRMRCPFVGQAGKVFDRELGEAGIDRSKCWVTNAVKCRTVRVSPSGGVVNRCPNNTELSDWLPLLIEELEIVRPAVIVCLGGVAAKAVIGKGFGTMTGQRGMWTDGPSGSRVIATFHPSYVNRSPAARQAFREDLNEAKRVSEGRI
ncbi:MAG: uracil-DNA glycosylase [Armatimonadota bacterium]|nr:uracil-DNA glycosylase [Armatimonadota bacterium]